MDTVGSVAAVKKYVYSGECGVYSKKCAYFKVVCVHWRVWLLYSKKYTWRTWRMLLLYSIMYILGSVAAVQ